MQKAPEGAFFIAEFRDVKGGQAQCPRCLSAAVQRLPGLRKDNVQTKKKTSFDVFLSEYWY
ncbi:MAG TPA: hypothetical protein DE191_10625 [Enterobacter sp.]|nr:hypothetical protein [Enterobacter sp.]